MKCEKKKCRTNIGGQAVLEGVMMRGERSMATAVRDERGEIQVESSRFTPIKEKSAIKRAPFIRGVFNLGTSMASGVKVLMRASEVFDGESEPTKFEKWCSEKLHCDAMKFAMYFAVFIGLALAIVLFFVLPQLIVDGIRLLTTTLGGYYPDYLDPILEGILRVIIFVLYIVLTSLMKEIKRVYMYHGAEHKTISCYEHGLELTVENVQKQSTIHDRCGTTFMFLVMVVSIAIFSLVSLLPIQTNNKVLNMFIELAIKIALLPLVAGVSYEILKLLAKYDNAFVRVIKAPGLLLQKVTTKQPTDDMVEVAITAFNTVLELDNNLNAKTTTFNTKVIMEKVNTTLDEVLKNIGSGNCDKEWIIAEVLGISRSEINSKTHIMSNEFDKMLEMAKRRASGEPLQQIFGYTDFYGMMIKVNRNVLCPRPETEYLVEACTNLIKSNSLENVLDMCTGSGAIALVIKRDNNVRVVGADISNEALEVAKENAKCNGLDVEFICSDLFSSVDGEYDLIVSNPPYIKSSVMNELAIEVRGYEPHIALDGGESGLDYYKRIINNGVEHLKVGGYFAFEIGYDQKDEVIDLLQNAEKGKFVDIVAKKDLEGNDRIIIAKLDKK